MAEPTISQQIADRQTQNARLIAFLQDHPDVYYTQETLAEVCGAHLGAVRTRLNELERDGEPLRKQRQTYTDTRGTHVGTKLWGYFPRPSAPLGPDASTYRESGLLFDMAPRG